MWHRAGCRWSTSSAFSARKEGLLESVLIYVLRVGGIIPLSKTRASIPPHAQRFADLMQMIFATREEDITCDECFEHLDHYVELLQAGQDPATVLPQVKHHLEQCRCCEQEFRALITILEGYAQAAANDESPAST